MDYLETILQAFPIDISSTKPLQLSGLSQETRIYKVNAKKSPLIEPISAELYLIDTPAGRNIACNPHIVSENLSKLCLDAAMEFTYALKEVDLVSGNSGILHILRGSSGYMIDKALPELPVIHIRTQYTEDGYRAHSDDARRIDVTYSDYNETCFDSLIVPDTYATGRSVEAALIHMFEHEFKVERVVIYGYIAASAIERVYRLLKEYDVNLNVFAIVDITQLYANNYDMPLYGLDEDLYKQNGIIKQLGSIVSKDTLHDMIKDYVPGMDQPGDWSERHNELFNGYGYESGDIRGHLQKSIELMESLDEINKQQPWYIEALSELTHKEIENCRRLLYYYSLH